MHLIMLLQLSIHLNLSGSLLFSALRPQLSYQFPKLLYSIILSFSCFSLSFRKFIIIFLSHLFFPSNYTMGNPVSINQKLLDFHRKCLPEFKYILKEFNLLFYGYGCKMKILNELFPDALHYNMRFSTTRDIIDDLIMHGYSNKAKDTLQDVDKFLGKEGKRIELVLRNFNFNDIELTNLKNISLISTFEDLNFQFTQEDLVLYNFILRDMTTFENYTEETMEMELGNSKVENTLLILKNTSDKSLVVFKELLQLGNCSLNQLFDKVKKSLMITKIVVVKELLHEFIDHRVIKIQENNIDIFLKKNEIQSVLKALNTK